MNQPYTPVRQQFAGRSDDAFKIRQYIGAGTAQVNEGVIDTGVTSAWGQPVPAYWATKAEAQAAADRVNAGDETGILFASYNDD